MRERNRLLKEQERDTGWYGALEGQMATSGAEISVNRRKVLERIIEAQRDSTTAFPAADMQIVDAEGSCHPEDPLDLAEALARNRSRDIAAGRTLVGPHRIDLEAVYLAKDAPAAQCSTGEQKALLVSLILANARALRADIGQAPLLLLDEVAAHLDAGRRSALYDELCALSAQAFMTGTGAELFDSLGPRAQYFEVTETEGLSALHERPMP